MKTLKIILLTIAPFVFMYLFFGFISMEFNPKNWNEAGQNILFIFLFVYSLALYALCLGIFFFWNIKNN